MKKLLILCYINLMATASVDYHKEFEQGEAKVTRQQIEKAEDGISNMVELAYHTNDAVRNILIVADKELRKRKHDELADKIENEWRFVDGYLVDAVVLNRDIGWYEPLIEWLAVTYELIEAKIGIDAARALRISDLKTINHGIPVCFRPCYYGLEEFKKHFIHDDKYRGLAPVVSYWTAALSCTAALHGAGYYFVCSPAATLIERVVDKRIAPRVAPKIYNAACTI